MRSTFFILAMISLSILGVALYLIYASPIKQIEVSEAQQWFNNQFQRDWVQPPVIQFEIIHAAILDEWDGRDWWYELYIVPSDMEKFVDQSMTGLKGGLEDWNVYRLEKIDTETIMTQPSWWHAKELPNRQGYGFVLKSRVHPKSNLSGYNYRMWYSSITGKMFVWAE